MTLLRSAPVLMAFALLSCNESCPDGPSIDAIEAGPDEAITIACSSNPLVGEPPPPYEVTIGGADYVLRNGYAWVPDGCGYRKADGLPETGYYATPLGPDFASAYSVDGCAISRIADDGSLVPVGKSFAAPFDTVDGPLACDLLGLPVGFTTFTLQSPSAPEVPDYLARRDCICNGSCSFADNRIEVLAEAAHDGARGLRCTSVGPTAQMTANGHPSKASIETPLVHYVRGDHVTLRAWFRIQPGGGIPQGLLDLESTWLDTAPGPRLLLENGALEVELKFGDKPRFRQESPLPIPIGPWVDIELTFDLQPDQTGRVQVRQDGTLLIDARGQTLPLPNTILNSLEIGITSHQGEAGIAVVDVDSLTASGTHE